ncbi:MAG: hypothetical protein LC623_05465 [Halobacteriales archaeon]|nr:hypothetical protein [Halobacteriales archaeon]
MDDAAWPRRSIVGGPRRRGRRVTLPAAATRIRDALTALLALRRRPPGATPA